MKLPRLKYSKHLEDLFLNKIAYKDLNASIKLKKDSIMKILESAKDLEELSQKVLGGMHEVISHLVSIQEDEDLARKLNTAMFLDELAYLGWLRYQMILGKKVEK